MVSSRYLGKTCPYCADPNSSNTRDHLIARQFLTVELRGDNIILPACNPCNNQKAALEDYATTVIPLNSNASIESQRAAKERLLKNGKYLRHMRETVQTGYQFRSGVLVPLTSVVVDGVAIDDLYRFIACGLFHKHTGRYVNWDTHCAVVTIAPTGQEADLIEAFDAPNRSTYSGSMGKGSFEYEGVVFDDDACHSIWRMNLHSLQMGIRGCGLAHPMTYVEFTPKWLVIENPPAEDGYQRLFVHPRSCRYQPLNPSSLEYKRSPRWLNDGHAATPSQEDIASAAKYGSDLQAARTKRGDLT